MQAGFAVSRPVPMLTQVGNQAFGFMRIAKELGEEGLG
jgi:hypothetical protein